MQIVFENANFVVANKKSGWLTIPGRFGDKDPRPCLGLELQKTVGSQIWPVHRLDFEVSGLVLFAKTAEAHKVANKAFETQQIKKTYEALTEGSAPNEQNFRWESKLLRGKKRAYEHAAGKTSITVAQFVGVKNGNLNWSLHPLTGRPHQLRVHLAQHGFPILGDSLYGSKYAFAKDSIALRAIRLEFSHCPELLNLGLPESLNESGLEI